MGFNYETIFTISGSSDQSDLTVRVDGIGVYFETLGTGEVGLSFDYFHQLVDHVKTLIPAHSAQQSGGES